MAEFFPVALCFAVGLSLKMMAVDHFQAKAIACRTMSNVCNEVVEPLWGQLVNLIACRDTVVTLL